MQTLDMPKIHTTPNLSLITTTVPYLGKINTRTMTLGINIFPHPSSQTEDTTRHALPVPDPYWDIQGGEYADTHAYSIRPSFDSGEEVEGAYPRQLQIVHVPELHAYK
jgi:hypothetical protein